MLPCNRVTSFVFCTVHTWYNCTIHYILKTVFIVIPFIFKWFSKLKNGSQIEFRIYKVSITIIWFSNNKLLQQCLLHRSSSFSGYLGKPPFLGPSISNKQRIQRWITVGVKSIAAGLSGTAIDYESVLVSRAPWWQKRVGRHGEVRE